MQTFGSILGELNVPVMQFNFLSLLMKSLPALSSLLNAQHLYFFEVCDEQNLKLLEASPRDLGETEFLIPISEIPAFTKAVRLKEATILNTLAEDNPLDTYIKAYFNIRVKSVAMFPVVIDNETAGILLLLKSDSESFSHTHYSIIKIFLDLFAHGLRIHQTRKQIGHYMDAAVFKYSYDFLDEIINHLNFGILVIDDEKRVQYLNQIAADLLYYPKKDVLYKSLDEILDARNMQILFTVQEESDATFERPELELEGTGGEKIFVGFTIQPYQFSDGKERGYIISLKDITYSKEMQEEIRRMDRLASLGVMASGIAHEIRNPLAGIKAIAQTFQEEFSPEDPKIEYVTRIVRQVNRLDDMLKSLFSYARPPRANRDYFQVEIILRDVLELLRQKLREHRIRLTELVDPSLPPVFVDKSQIQQVLFNLILNSIEAIENSGEIKIEIKPVVPPYPKFSRKPFYQKIIENPFLEMHIKDSGKGISSENLKQIFNPFFTTKTFGTGLGLSIVYQIIKENDGIIYFESEPERGTNCYLFLPAFNKKESEQKPTESA